MFCFLEVLPTFVREIGEFFFRRTVIQYKYSILFVKRIIIYFNSQSEKTEN
jgi:hypothetical protein